MQHQQPKQNQQDLPPVIAGAQQAPAAASSQPKHRGDYSHWFIEAPYILTFDRDRPLVKDGAVVINTSTGLVEGLGPAAALRSRYSSPFVMRLSGKVCVYLPRPFHCALARLALRSSDRCLCQG